MVTDLLIIICVHKPTAPLIIRHLGLERLKFQRPVHHFDFVCDCGSRVGHHILEKSGYKLFEVRIDALVFLLAHRFIVRLLRDEGRPAGLRPKAR